MAVSEPQTTHPTGSEAKPVLGHPRVSNRRLDKEAYDRGLPIYLEHGTEYSLRKAGYGEHQARKLVHQGIPHLGLPPYSHAARLAVSKEDRIVTRLAKAAAEGNAKEAAQALDARRKEIERVREAEKAVVADAARSREDEVRMVRANRLGALALARVGADLLHSAAAISADIRAQAEAGKLATLSINKKLDLVKSVATIAQRTAEVSARAVQMERLLMGEPTAILGHAASAPVADMTPEDAERWFEIAQRAFDRRAKRRQVIDATPVAEPTAAELGLLEPGEELLDDVLP